MTEYESFFKALINLHSGVKAAAIFTKEGFPIKDFLLGNNCDIFKISAIASAMLSMGIKAVEELDKSKTYQITIEFLKGYLIFTFIDKQEILFVHSTEYINFKKDLPSLKRSLKK